MAIKWSFAAPLVSFVIDLLICGYKWYYNVYSHEKEKNRKLCGKEIKRKFIGAVGGTAISCGLTMFLGMGVIYFAFSFKEMECLFCLVFWR